MDQSKPLTPDQLKEFLESNLTSLINHLEVERIIPKFRDAQLFDKRDAEIISSEYKYPTSSDKAGALLDTVVRRGPKAIQLLFDHVEKQHPDLYKEITGREPTITITRMHTILNRKKGGLPAGLTVTILTQLTEMMEDKEKQEKELDQRKRDLAERERKIQRLTRMNRKMDMKVKALLSKNEESDKLQTELTHRTTMLKEVQNKLLKCQREAEKAKHHARMATFKNFHLEYELREMSNKRNLERRQTRNLQRSVKNHEIWLSEHKISYTFDHRKVEELQKELEKIDDFRKSVAIGEEVCEISERVQSQLSKARDTNEGLNVKLQRTLEKNEGLTGEIALLKKERNMMRETMQMNRLHLEMSQQELEIVSRERVKLNEAYEELLKDMSQSFLNTRSLQERLAKVRFDYAVLSERIMNAGDGSVDTSGIFLHSDMDDDLVDDDDTGVDGEDDLESEEDVIIPVPRPRLQRIVSKSSSRGSKLEQMKTLTESFEKETSSSSRSHTMTSSSSTTTGEEDPTDSLDIGRISGFPDYHFRGSSDDADDADDDDDDVDSMAQRLSRLESDFEFVDHQSTAVRSRPRTRRRPRLSDNRRSRSLSRLEDYETFENMDFLEPQPGCYRYAPMADKDTPLCKSLPEDKTVKNNRSSSRVESWLLVSNSRTSIPKLRVNPLQVQERELIGSGDKTENSQESSTQPSEQWIGAPIEETKPGEPSRSKRIKNLSGLLVMNRGSYRFGVHRKGPHKVIKCKEKSG